MQINAEVIWDCMKSKQRRKLLTDMGIEENNNLSYKLFQSIPDDIKIDVEYTLRMQATKQCPNCD